MASGGRSNAWRTDLKRLLTQLWILENVRSAKLLKPGSSSGTFIGGWDVVGHARSQNGAGRVLLR